MVNFLSSIEYVAEANARRFFHVSKDVPVRSEINPVPSPNQGLGPKGVSEVGLLKAVVSVEGNQTRRYPQGVW